MAIFLKDQSLKPLYTDLNQQIPVSLSRNAIDAINL